MTVHIWCRLILIFQIQIPAELSDVKVLPVHIKYLTLFYKGCHLSFYEQTIDQIKLLAPELFFLILAHPVYKMWIIQEPNTLDLWNKLHFEEEKTESI